MKSLLSWLEFRVLVSTYFVLKFYLAIGLIDSIVKFMLEWLLSYCCSLPVTINYLHIDTSTSSLNIHGFRILSPPIELDHRWHTDYIIEIKEATVVLNLMTTLYWCFGSNMGLIVVDTIDLKNATIVIEGHEDYKNGVTYFNVNLLGATVPAKAKDSDIMEELADLELHSMAEAFFSPSRHITAASTSSLNEDSLNEPEGHQGASNVATNSTDSHPQIIFPTIQSQGSCPVNVTNSETNVGSSTQQFVPTWIEWLLGSNSLDTSVRSPKGNLGGFYDIGNHIANLFQHARRKVGATMKQQIEALHERISGPEPKAEKWDMRFMGRWVRIRGIQACFRNVLPASLRYLERRPLQGPPVALFLHEECNRVPRDDNKSCAVLSTIELCLAVLVPLIGDIFRFILLRFGGENQIIGEPRQIWTQVPSRNIVGDEGDGVWHNIPSPPSEEESLGDLLSNDWDGMLDSLDTKVTARNNSNTAMQQTELEPVVLNCYDSKATEKRALPNNDFADGLVHSICSDNSYDLKFTSSGGVAGMILAYRLVRRLMVDVLSEQSGDLVSTALSAWNDARVGNQSIENDEDKLLSAQEDFNPLFFDDDF